MKTILQEGNRRKSYGSVGTSRGDVGGMTYSTGKAVSGASSRLTNTGRGGYTPTVRAPAADGAKMGGERPHADRVSRGQWTLPAKTGATPAHNGFGAKSMKLGLTGDIYTKKAKY